MPPSSPPPSRALPLRSRTAAAALLAALALALAATPGCSWRRTAWELGLGSFATDLLVTRAVPRGPYVDATLVGHGLTLEVLAPDTPACRFVLRAESRVDYVERGVGGRYEREDAVCQAAGGGIHLVGSRQPRSTTLAGTPVPRSQATFQVLHADAELMLLRGDFPEAARIGWAGAVDTVAAVPAIPVCRSAVQEGVASMEYRAGARNPLTLVGDEGLCPIRALARPPQTGTARAD